MVWIYGLDRGTELVVRSAAGQISDGFGGAIG